MANMSHLVLLLGLLASPATADDDLPLAIPADVAQPAEIKLRAMRDYRSHRLNIRNETEVHGGGVRVEEVPVYSPFYGYGWDYKLVREPLSTSRTWAVFRGEQRLDVPSFLGLVGEKEGLDSLNRDILRAHRSSRILTVIGFVGAGVALGGLLGMDASITETQYRNWSLVSLAGVGVCAGGFVGSTLQSAKRDRLRTRPSMTLEVPGAQARVDVYNQRLAKDLGLTAEDVLQFELQ
jgi:hypothetical protein